MCEDIFNIYKKTLINGFILTDISRDGTMKGLNIDLIKKLVSMTKKNVIVGGGLSSYSDLKKIKDISAKNKNLEGVISGKSFYTGIIKIDKALALFEPQ